MSWREAGREDTENVFLPRKYYFQYVEQTPRSWLRDRKVINRNFLIKI